MSSLNSFGSRAMLTVDGTPYTIFRLDSLARLSGSNVDRLPFSLKVLLENLLRHEDDAFVKRSDIEALAKWDVKGGVEKEIAFRPSRVLLQDFTGVPPSSISPPCATPSHASAVTPSGSTRFSPSTS
jgi:aconitate hydratase